MAPWESPHSGAIGTQAVRRRTLRRSIAVTANPSETPVDWCYSLCVRLGHIFRWDLDKTYLKTEFDSVRDLVRTARMPAEARENVPGSAALLRVIRDGAPDGRRHRIYFISGSPEQMRGVIEKKFALDGFSPDGFVLKPTVSNLLRGRFRAVRSQVEYKLHELVSMRAEAPVGTPETLFGDDAESDAFIYSLYADLLAGRVDRATLRKILKRVGSYRDQIEAIEEGLEAIIHEDPVRRIIIHLDRNTPHLDFRPYFPRAVPIRSHLQTAIVLALDKTLPSTVILAVARELLDLYGVSVESLEDLADDVLRRVRAYHHIEHQAELADELEELLAAAAERRVAADEEAVGPSSAGFDDAHPRTPEGDEALQVLRRIAARARQVARESPPGEVPEDLGMTSTPDYLDIWNREVRRREVIKARLRSESRSANGARESLGTEASPSPEAIRDEPV